MLCDAHSSRTHSCSTVLMSCNEPQAGNKHSHLYAAPLHADTTKALPHTALAALQHLAQRAADGALQHFQTISTAQHTSSTSTPVHAGQNMSDTGGRSAPASRPCSGLLNTSRCTAASHTQPRTTQSPSATAARPPSYHIWEPPPCPHPHPPTLVLAAFDAVLLPPASPPLCAASRGSTLLPGLITKSSLLGCGTAARALQWRDGNRWWWWWRVPACWRVYMCLCL